MKRKHTVVALLVITALALWVHPLVAQQSETSKASHFHTTDVDKFMNYFEFGNVEFDSYFGYLGAGMTENYGTLNLGYARHLGSLYLGAYYSGSTVFYDSNKTETVESEYNREGFRLWNSYKLDDYVGIGSSRSSFSTANSLDVLIGIGNMGIKVGVVENLSGSLFGQNSTTQLDQTKFPNYTDYTGLQLDSVNSVHGTVAPWVGWGMPLAVGAFQLKPTVEAGLQINLHDHEEVWKGDTDSRSPTAERSYFGTIDTRLYPTIEIGAEAVMEREEDAEIGFGLSYRFNIGLDATSYSVNGVSGSGSGMFIDQNTGFGYSATSTVTRGNNYTDDTKSTTLNLYDQFDMGHLITPSAYYFKPLSDRVDFGFGGEVAIGIYSDTGESRMEITTVTKTTPVAGGYTYNTETSTRKTVAKIQNWDITSLTISPELYAGVSYQILPEKFVLNTGFGISLFNYTNSTVLTTTYQNNNVTTEKTVDVNGNTTDEKYVNYDNSGAIPVPAHVIVTDTRVTRETWDLPNLDVGLGFTLFFTPTFSMDTSAVSTLSYTSVGGMTNQFSLPIGKFHILFTYKK